MAVGERCPPSSEPRIARRLRGIFENDPSGQVSNRNREVFSGMLLKRISILTLVLSAVLLVPRIALAHAHLVTSTPAANATVPGPNVVINLKYNSRVETRGSTITLALSNGETERLPLDKQSNEVNLDAHAHLKPGSYTLRWQALSTDGHITRGEIPFTVR